MVMYEVGFKCPTCAKKRPSHFQQAAIPHFVAGCLGGFTAGLAYGWLFFQFGPLLGAFRFLGIPILLWILSYLLGQTAGRLLQRLLRYKYQHALTGCVLAFSGLGLLLSPFMQVLQPALEVLGTLGAGGGTSVELFLLGRGLSLAGAVFFLRGLFQPFKAP